MTLPTDELGREHVTRYVVTYVGKDGYRKMVGPRQGRCTYETEEAADHQLKAMLSNNHPGLLADLYGDTTRMAVKPCRCYPVHFDPMDYYFEPEKPNLSMYA